MRWPAAISFSAAVILSSPTWGQKTFPIRLTTDSGFHMPLQYRDKTIKVRMAQDEHFVFMVEDSLDSLGLPKDILVLESRGFKNGVARMWVNFYGVKVKIIIYDPIEIVENPNRRREAELINAGSALFTIAHEIGHHVCDHVVNGGGSTPIREIEADTIAGAILTKSYWREFFGNLDFPRYVQIMRRTLPAEPSETHPGIDDRIAAFQNGWNGGPNCARRK